MRDIYRKIRHARYLYIKRNVEKVWGARYTLGASYLSKNTVLFFRFCWTCWICIKQFLPLSLKFTIETSVSRVMILLQNVKPCHCYQNMLRRMAEGGKFHSHR